MSEIFHFLSHPFSDTLLITAFVMMMMLLIEYINVQSHGNWSRPFQKSKWLQVVFASLVGLTPGCLGAFTIVSLYTHNILNFASLVAVMIATAGDEAFVMFSLFPGKALFLHGILFIIAIIAGSAINLLWKKQPVCTTKGQHFHIHDSDSHIHFFDLKNIMIQFKRISFVRALLIIVLTLFLGLLFSNQIGHEESWGSEHYLLLLGSLFTLFIFITVPDHFLEHHLWEHVIKKHLPRIFLWTFGALFVIQWLEHFMNIEEWVRNNQFSILFIALLIGLIPESGPHLVFTTMFFQGVIPFSILLANSIVQDGHGMLPLLAESKKSVVLVKGINLLISLGVGWLGLSMGW